MNASTRKEFSRRFRQALNEAGYKKTQLKELGSLFEVSSQAVRKWLNGDALPSSSRAPQIAMKLGVRRAWLLDGEPPIRSIGLKVNESNAAYTNNPDPEALTISDREYRLLCNYRSLPIELQKTIDTLLREINS
ncbi:MAG: hypothetical protein CMP91_08660 [Gammaproteobacteria bacterium]|nr:hypothetical protein [Gammaproteobacteria bacterium]MAY02673.1 hypothetical protein [Gammaproteobacteria bacterium]